jgi:hypothetical protein
MFHEVIDELKPLIGEWEQRLMSQTSEQISVPRNGQNRNIRQIVGHMVDSASNNTHRVVHLQYRELPLRFPNYATYGNNDKWIAIQNYENENWENLVQLWNYTHLHFLHVIGNVSSANLKNEWVSDPGTRITLEKMVEDFPRHFKLHIAEIEELLATQ